MQESPAPAREAISTSVGLKVGGRADRTLIVAAEEYPVPPNFDQRPGLAMSAAVAGTLAHGELEGLGSSHVASTRRTLSVSNRATSNKVTMRVPSVKRSAMLSAVNNDWMLDSDEVKHWESVTGRKNTRDACCDPEVANSHCGSAFNSPNNSFLTSDCTGEDLLLNPPFIGATLFLSHFEKCRRASPSNTTAIIILPAWKKDEWRPFLDKY